MTSVLPDLSDLEAPEIRALLLGLLERLYATPAEDAARERQRRLLTEARNRFLEKIAPELKSIGWTLGTIGRVTSISSNYPPLVFNTDGTVAIRIIVPSKLEQGYGVPIVGLSVRCKGEPALEADETCIAQTVSFFWVMFTGFLHGIEMPLMEEGRAATAKAKEMNMTSFCMGQILFTATDVHFGWQLLPAEALLTPQDTGAHLIQFDAPRPALFSKPTQKEKKTTTKRKAADDASLPIQQPTKKPKTDPKRSR